MKSLLISALLVAGLTVVLYRSYFKRDPPPAGGAQATPSETFLKRCVAVAEPERGASGADSYCRCLWAKGVTDVAQTISSPAGRAAETECRAALAPSTTGGAPSVPSTRSPMPTVPTVRTTSQEPPATPQ